MGQTLEHRPHMSPGEHVLWPEHFGYRGQCGLLGTVTDVLEYLMKVFLLQRLADNIVQY